MIKEIWKDIKDYEGLYQVSNLSRVKSLDRWVKGRNGSLRICKERILKPGTDKYGYLFVILCKNGKVKKFSVHRLVAEAFIANPHNYPCVNHKDENKQNNNVSNLEWCDVKYNTNYGTAIKRRSKPVLQYTMDGAFVKEWESITECGRNGFSSGCVCMCCRGELKTYKDFIWKYL